MRRKSTTFLSFFFSLLRFIGVLVYSCRWNYFWQINKTLALVLSNIYSCINPFALFFLSSTFRHFFKRYLCCWTKSNYSSSTTSIEFTQTRRRCRRESTGTSRLLNVPSPSTVSRIDDRGMNSSYPSNIKRIPMTKLTTK